jgi:hypothetical protein
MLGADRLRGDTLDRLCDACESTGTGLVLAYRAIPPHVKQRLGRGNAAVAYMRLGNAEDAKAASEQLGTEHRFVLSQLTDTIGRSVTDTTAGSYTSTTGSTSSLAASWSASEGTARSTGHGRTETGGVLPSRASGSRNVQTSDSRGTSESESVSAGISTSTAWGMTTSRATGDSQSLARALQRSREFLVEQHELQQLPVSAMIVSYAAPPGRQVVMADANPGIGGLSAATLLTLEESRSLPAACEVVIPQAVLVLIPALTVSLSLMPRESLVWTLRDPVARDGSTLPVSVRPCPVLRAVPSLADRDAASELVEPMVAVYELAVVSVTERPIVSVSWDSTKRCSVPSCSLAALASSALPSLM